VLLRRRKRRLSVGTLQARLRGKAAPCRLMHMLMPPRFRRLLIDSDAGPLYSAVSSSIPLSCAVSSPPSARFRLLLATGCSIWKGTAAAVDLEGEQRGMGAEQRIRREGRSRGRKRSRRGKWSGGETSGGGRVVENEEQRWRGFPLG